jgi:hypothetical protein
MVILGQHFPNSTYIMYLHTVGSIRMMREAYHPGASPSGLAQSRPGSLCHYSFALHLSYGLNAIIIFFFDS